MHLKKIHEAVKTVTIISCLDQKQHETEGGAEDKQAANKQNLSGTK